MNLDLLYAILIALLFICVFVLFSNFSIMNTIIVSIVFYMIYNVIFTDEYEDGVVLGGNEANHIDDLKEPDDIIIKVEPIPNKKSEDIIIKVEPKITKKHKVSKKQKNKSKHISSK